MGSRSSPAATAGSPTTGSAWTTCATATRTSPRPWSSTSRSPSRRSRSASCSPSRSRSRPPDPAAAGRDPRRQHRDLHDPEPCALPAAGAVHGHHHAHGRDRARPLRPHHPGPRRPRRPRRRARRGAESATGSGTARARMLFRIELPLALPVMMAGLRVATVSTVALTTVGTLVSYGGLGNLIQDGVCRTTSRPSCSRPACCASCSRSSSTRWSSARSGSRRPGRRRRG